MSCVGVQALAWNWPTPQVEQATQLFPTRWDPGAHAVQVEASLQAAQPAGHAAQVASVVDVHAVI